MKWRNTKSFLCFMIFPFTAFLGLIILAIVDWKVFFGVFIFLMGVAGMIDDRMNFLISLIDKKENKKEETK